MQMKEIRDIKSDDDEINMISECSKQELKELKDKFIFHGSHHLFDICKPQKAKCDTHAKENELTAIYGSDDINFAVLFAFQKLPKEHYSWSANYVNGEWRGFLYDDTYIDNNDYGYLYIFNKSDFAPTSKGSSQFVCKKALKPIKIIKVFYKDFKERFVKCKEK